MKERRESQNIELDKADLINLLGYYLQILPPRWQSLQTYMSIYITLATGILGVTIAGFATIKEYPIVYLLEIGPLLGFFVSEFAKQTIKRQNEHIKELIVLIAKIEYEIGLYEPISLNKHSRVSKPWPDDKSFIPPRWFDARVTKMKTSEEFITYFQKSSAKFAYDFFRAFQVLSLLLAVAIILLRCFVSRS